MRMCIVEELEWRMGAKGRMELKNAMMFRSRMRVWMGRGMTGLLVWTTCVLVLTCSLQLIAMEETWGPRLLKGLPSCFSHSDLSLSLQLPPPPPKLVLPPKSRFWVQFPFVWNSSALLFLEFVLVQFWCLVLQGNCTF